MKTLSKNLDILLNELFECVLTIDNTQKIIQWNNAMESFIGILKHDALSRHLFEVIPSLREECKYYLEEALIKEKRIIEVMNFTFLKPKSKQKTNVRLKLIPILNDENEVVRILMLFKELHPNNEYAQLLESVVNNANDAVLITKSEPIEGEGSLKIIYANPAFTKMTGYELKEVLGYSPRILQGEETSTESKKYISSKLKQWEKVNCELLNYTKDGEKFWVDLDIVPAQNEEGYYTHWTAIQRDTTEKRERIEQLRILNEKLEIKVKERTQELENFMYFLAHDLKHPVRLIHSFIDLIKRIEPNFQPPILEYFGHIQQGAKSINNMVSSLSRLLVIKQTTLHLSVYSIEEIIDRAKHNLINAIQETNATITLQKMPLLKVDFNLMIQVFQNVIGNAIKYKSEASPIIDIYHSSTANTIKIHIKDNGMGFGKYTKGEMFQLFNRSKHSENATGFGVGLYICSIIIEKHEGNIYIEPNTTVGSTISIELPKSCFILR